MTFSVEVTIVLAVLCYLVYFLFSRKNDYWRKRGVAGPSGWSFGSLSISLFSSLSKAELFRKLYDDYRGERYVGFYWGSKPTLIVRDPDLIRAVLAKDFEYFPDRAQSFDEDGDPISANLFNIEGVRWKNLRAKLTPTFTSGKIKRMFPLMLECSSELQGVLDPLSTRKEAVELKDIFARFSTDVIGTCAFGISCNSLKNPNSEFRKHGVQIFSTSFWSKLRKTLLYVFPKNRLLHKLLNRSGLNKFMSDTVRENVTYREENNIQRGDFLDLLIEIKNKGKIVDNDVDLVEDPFLHVPVSTSSDEFKFTEKSMVAQAFVFFAAGFETSSTTMSFCTIELTHNPDIQKRAQEDVDAAIRKHGGITYEALADMTYLDKVVSETLRKYSPASALPRICKRRYLVPDSELVLEPDTRIMIPVDGLHYDEEYFPDPHRFNPDRFDPEAKASRRPYSYLPFGEGPRMCIGMRFGLVEMKLGLATLLSRYDVMASPLTQYPVVYMKGSFVTTNVDGCHVFITRRPDTAETVRKSTL